MENLIKVLNSSGESVVVNTSDGSLQSQELILITHIVLSNFPLDGKKHKVFFVVLNERKKYYWGTDRVDLDVEVIQRYVKNGTLRELKEPILIKKDQALWVRGEEKLNLYVGGEREDVIPFGVTLLGEFKNIVG